MVVPLPEKVAEWAKANGKEEKDAYTDEGFKAQVLDSIKEIGKKNKLSSLEIPKDVNLSEEPFSVENNLITPTFKMKRHVAKTHFKTVFD